MDFISNVEAQQNMHLVLKSFPKIRQSHVLSAETHSHLHCCYVIESNFPFLSRFASFPALNGAVLMLSFLCTISSMTFEASCLLDVGLGFGV